MGDLIDRVGVDQWSAPTPCTEWTVRDVVHHLVGMNLVFVALLEERPMPDRGADHVGTDPAGAYRRSAAALQVAAARPGVLQRRPSPSPAPLLTTGHTPAATVAIITLVVFFGLGYGLPDLLRGTLLVDYYGPHHYPRINGTIAIFVVVARATGPLLAGLAVTAFGGHSASLLGA